MPGKKKSDAEDNISGFSPNKQLNSALLRSNTEEEADFVGNIH